jgi:metal-responsive CopG/Arc/MetJ family transcriptional regulator
MGKIMVTLSDELENRLREHLRKQGDLSRIVTEALESYLDRIEKKVKK